MAEEKQTLLRFIDTEISLDLVGVEKKCQSNANYTFACTKTRRATYLMLQ